MIESLSQTWSSLRFRRGLAHLDEIWLFWLDFRLTLQLLGRLDFLVRDLKNPGDQNGVMTSTSLNILLYILYFPSPFYIFFFIIYFHNFLRVMVPKTAVDGPYEIFSKHGFLSYPFYSDGKLTMLEAMLFCVIR